MRTLVALQPGQQVRRAGRKPCIPPNMALIRPKHGCSRLRLRATHPCLWPQVTIAYVDCLEPGAARRAALRERFCFECTCERCSMSQPADAFLGVVRPSEDAGGRQVLELEAALEAAIATGASLFLDQVCRA